MAAPKSNKNKTQPPATIQNFPIVGVGASAGGLDAFKRLLAAIPEKSGMAYVLVQHLDPFHESVLPEILQRVTKIPVLEITDDIHLAPDHIYIIPSNKMLTSTDGVLKLSNREKKINLAVDVFFTSLAEVHKELAVGVVLSGSGSDGTLGLKAIKEYGGICIAQDSETATFISMPQSAVNAGVVDFVLTPEEIPSHLLKIDTTFKNNTFIKNNPAVSKDDEAAFNQILFLLRERSGVDFSYYKQPTFYRRIARRIAIVKKENLSEYLKFLRSDKSELDALFLDVLIPVTSFFRDPETFLELKETVFPAILKNKLINEPIRIWIAGCSTGEEAFSIAICLKEFLGEKSSKIKIQIFASDISEKAIKKARTAIYTKANLEKLSENQRNNYFVKNNGNYEVNKMIRDMCVFAPHNFLQDPPFAKIDLISCRNVLIYMDTFLQKKAFSTFHYALKENGFLLLGKSETIGVSSDLFSQVNKIEKIYLRKSLPGRLHHVVSDIREEALKIRTKAISKQEINHSDFRKSAEALMILKSPASVVINEHNDIVHIHGNITPFLQSPQGKPTHNIIKMAREGLAFELRNTIHKVKKEQSSVLKENIPIKVNEVSSLISIEIIPLPDTIEMHYLIQFEKEIVEPDDAEKKSETGNINLIQNQNQHLEKELSQIREDMRYITEDMEATNEEMQSAIEEMQSSNEEMQSLNEELETSKEELQSTNEELTIVNQELQDKQDQLNDAQYYAESIITTVRESLIVLDKSLRIKTANASFYKKFRTEKQDTEGKLFYEIQNKQWDDDLMRSLLERILPEHERLTDFEIILNFPDLGERHLQLNALQIENKKQSEQLILLAIEDITDRKTADQKLETTRNELAEKNRLIETSESTQKKLATQLKLATDSAKVGIWSLDILTLKIQWSDLHKTMWGYDKNLKDPTYEDWHRVILENDKALAFQRVEEAKINHTIYEVDYRIKRANDGKIVWIKSTGQYQYDEDGEARIICGISIDITEQKMFSKALEKKVEERTTELALKSKQLKTMNQSLELKNIELENTNAELKSFTHIASHDLQEPLRKIQMFSKRIIETEMFTDKTLDSFNRIISSSERMQNLIISLLNFSTNDNTEFKKIACDLNDIIKESENDLHLKIAETNAIITFDNLPAIKGLPHQLSQLFTNLIDNAIKYSRPKVVPEIKISSQRVSGSSFSQAKAKANTEYLAIKLEDNGIGFENEYANKIFELFQRLHHKNEYSGTGIGLAIVKKIVLNHNGFITAEGTPNVGAVFTIYLPIK